MQLTSWDRIGFSRLNQPNFQSKLDTQVVTPQKWGVEGPEEIELPIDGVLDLHTFKPKDIKALVPDYLGACRAKGILRVRIIHGKGIGALRETVHAILRKLPEVASFNLAGELSGSWGATIVSLRPPEVGGRLPGAGLNE